jgi:hypothetical protein
MRSVVALPLLALLAACAGGELVDATRDTGADDRGAERDAAADSPPTRPDVASPDVAPDPDALGTDTSDVADDGSGTPADAGADTGEDTGADAPADLPAADVTELPVTPPGGCCGAECPDVCAPDRLVVGLACVGCSTPGEDGVCDGGTSYSCTDADHTPCESIVCGDQRYFCTNDGGSWAWRDTAACDDGVACTSGDFCADGACTGRTYACAPRECPAGSCADGSLTAFDTTCDRACDGEGGCLECECTQRTKLCDVGPANECCAPTCDPATGCATVAGSCGVDVCTDPNELVLAATCAGCGVEGASGACVGGARVRCDAVTRTPCETVSCGGAAYTCTNAGGTWQWRASRACDDGNPCTYNDTCGVTTCAGSPVTCTDTACLDRECNGTAACSETARTGAACDDGNACFAPDTCSAAGICTAGPAAFRCGDGTCSCGETNATCAADCPVTLPANACTNGSQNRRGCGNARVVSRGLAAAGWTSGEQNTCSSGESNRFDGECGALFDVGYEHVYALYMLAGERVTAELAAGTRECASGEYFNTFLKFRFNTDPSAAGATSCPTLQGCWGGPNEDETWTYTRTFDAPADGWFFGIVDGGASAFDEHRGYYTLDLTLSGCAAASCGC